MIFAVNSLLYLNQSVPPYGVSLNSLTAGTTVFPLRKDPHHGGFGGFGVGWGSRGATPRRRALPAGMQEGVKLTLDCAQAAFISYDKMVISLKGGEM